MAYDGYMVVILIVSVVSQCVSQSIIQMYPKTHRVNTDDNEMYCDSWKFSVETNDAGTWYTLPDNCVDYVEEYMTGERYLSDSEMVANYSVVYLNSLNLTAQNNAWVFDIDDTLLSSVPYYVERGFGSSYDEEAVNVWVNSSVAPALPASLRLYKEVQESGVKIFLLTGRYEKQRNITLNNLLSAGYSGWEKLFMRGSSDEEKSTIVYKSEKRKEIEDEGYIIQANSGDQWSDLLGNYTANRSFKLPNLLYYS